MIEKDPIKHWSQVDVKVIHSMHARFDVDTGLFLDKPEEESSVGNTGTRADKNS